MWGQQGGNWNNPPPYQQQQPNFNMGAYQNNMNIGMNMGPQLDPNITYKILSSFNPIYCID
jgi:hypothetical protein